MPFALRRFKIQPRCCRWCFVFQRQINHWIWLIFGNLVLAGWPRDRPNLRKGSVAQDVEDAPHFASKGISRLLALDELWHQIRRLCFAWLTRELPSTRQQTGRSRTAWRKGIYITFRSQSCRNWLTLRRLSSGTAGWRLAPDRIGLARLSARLQQDVS